MHDIRSDGGDLGRRWRRSCRRGARHHRWPTGCRTHAAFGAHAPAADARAWQVLAALHLAGVMLPCQPSGFSPRWLAWQHFSARCLRSAQDLSATRPVRTASASNPAHTLAPASERLLCVLTICASWLHVRAAGHRQAARDAHYYVRAVLHHLHDWDGAYRRLNKRPQPRRAPRRTLEPERA